MSVEEGGRVEEDVPVGEKKGCAREGARKEGRESVACMRGERGKEREKISHHTTGPLSHGEEQWEDAGPIHCLPLCPCVMFG